VALIAPPQDEPKEPEMEMVSVPSEFLVIVPVKFPAQELWVMVIFALFPLAVPLT